MFIGGSNCSLFRAVKRSWRLSGNPCGWWVSLGHCSRCSKGLGMGEAPAAKGAIFPAGCGDGLRSPSALENASERGFSAQLLLFHWHHPSRPTRKCRGSQGRAQRSAPAAISARCGDGNFLVQRWFQTAEGKTCPARTSQFQPATWGKRDYH